MLLFVDRRLMSMQRNAAEEAKTKRKEVLTLH